MKKWTFAAAACAAIALLWSFSRSSGKMAAGSVSASAQTERIVAAADAFLGMLSADQRKVAQLEFLHPKLASATQFNMAAMRGGPPRDSNMRRGRNAPPANGGNGNGGNGSAGNGGGGKAPDDNDHRSGPPASGEQYGKAVWSNFPITITPRPGIQLGSLNASQRAAATKLLKLLLSQQGFEKVEEIMGSDQALADSGTDFEAGKDHYLIAIFGQPDATQPWMVEFGGHHLGMNIVIAGERGALTPTLTGAQPSVYTVAGKTVRVLAGENDKAFDLLNAFDTVQRRKAILNYHIGDLVVGPGHDGQTIVPEGLKASDMTSQQRRLLVSLITEWAGIINDAYLKAHMDQIEAGLDSTWFAWSGPTTHEPGKNGSAYYRIQGPEVLIEFAPQATFGDATIHVHTIYRDPTNEYGNAYITQ